MAGVLQGGCREAAQRFHWGCTGAAGALRRGGAAAWDVAGWCALSLLFSLRAASCCGLPLGLASKFLHMPNDNCLRTGWRTTVLLLLLLLCPGGGRGDPLMFLGFVGKTAARFATLRRPRRAENLVP